VKPLSTLGYHHLTLLSKPAADRTVYQLIKKNKFQSFLEIGMGTGQRCQQILRVADKFSNKPVRDRNAQKTQGFPSENPIGAWLRWTVDRADCKLTPANGFDPDLAGHSKERTGQRSVIFPTDAARNLIGPTPNTRGTEDETANSTGR